MSCYSATCTGALAAGASQSITANHALLLGIIVNTDGTNAATVTVFDNPSAASGKVLARMIVPGATRFANFTAGDWGIEAMTGLFVTVTGTGSEAIVYWSPQ